jgi:hypothetical protein
MRASTRQGVLVLACAAALVAAAGCGGGGGGGGGTAPVAPVPFTAATLVAVAGPDQEIGQVATTKSVTLDGSKSFFRDSSTTTRAPSAYEWTVVQNPGAIAFANLPTATARVTLSFPAAPAEGTYTFQLRVTEGGATDTDTVNVIVKKFVVKSIADLVQMGFSTSAVTKTASITATLEGTLPANVNFTWTGMPPAPFFKNVLTTATAQTGTLSFTAPKIDEVEALPPAPSILGLWAHAGGYHRITVTATDASDPANTDSEDFIVSFGLPTSGLNVVPLRVPVYLNGGDADPATSYVYTITVPGGQTPTLFNLANQAISGTVNGTQGVYTTTQRVVWFQVPAEGQYTAIVERVSGGIASSAVFLMTAAQYVSDGLIGTIAPNPELGQCASCHGGAVSFLEDKVSLWLGTKHAQQAEPVFDPANATIQARIALTDLAPELNKATTGFYLARSTTQTAVSPANNAAASFFTAQDGGFDDLAASKGFYHRGIDFDTFVHRYPEVARLSQTQCETCHGPGSLHFGDSEAIAVSIKVDVCARCHEHEPAQWANSMHRQVVASPSTSGSCVRCHTAEGAADDRAIAYAYNTDVSKGAPPLTLPVPNEEGRSSTATCATCHDPHDASNPIQLRVVGDFVMPDGTTVQAGQAASCLRCHNARRSWKTASIAANRNDAHVGGQGDMFTGTNGAEFAGFTYVRSRHSDPTRFVFAFGPKAGQQGRFCIECHMGATPAAGQPGHDLLGGHSFAVRAGEPGSEVVNSNVCTNCHQLGTPWLSARGQEFNTTARDDYDGNGSIQHVQEEVAGLLKLLGGSEAASEENPFGIVEAPRVATDPSALLIRLAQKIDPLAIGVETSHGTLWIVESDGNGGEKEVKIPATADGELLYKALWNYYLTIDDKSFGIHNTGYTVGLLQSSIINIKAALGDPAFNGTIFHN